MLDVLRDNAQSWIVKLLFAAIVVVFVFWGVGSFTSDRDGVLAVVNDRQIKITDYIRAYENAVQNLRQQYPDITSSDLREMQLKQQIFNQLLNSELLLQKARDLGITVVASELQREITRLPAFLSEDQRFDPRRYELVLRSHQLTPAQFERDFQQNMLLEKMENYIALPSRPNVQEVEDFFNYIRSRVTIDYLKFSRDDFIQGISPTDEEITAYYHENRSQFMVPEKIRISYIKLTPRALAPLQDVTLEEIEDYYRVHQNEFVQEERLSARHILLSVDPDASEEEIHETRQKVESIRQRIEQGELFADLAREYSQCPSANEGGDLGSFGRGQMVPEFEEAAFGMSPGEVSQAVRTQFGWHLIQVYDYTQAGTRQLDEVRSRIRMLVGEEKAMDQMADTMDDILEVIITGGSLNQAASRLSLEIRETDFFSREQGPRDLPLSTAAISQLFAMDETETTETPIMIEDGYVFAQKTGVREAAVKDLEEVRENIKQILTGQKAMDLAREKAREYLNEVTLEVDLSPEKESLLKRSLPFDRQGFIPELGMSAELASEAFAVSQGQWLDRIYSVGDGYVVARVAQHIRPSKEEFLREKDQWMASYREMQKQQAFESFISMLRNQAKIRVFRPDIIEG